MATKKGDEQPKRKLAIPAKQKKVQTVRERALAQKKDRSGRLRRGAATVVKPVKKVNKLRGGKEYHLPLPDNKFGRFMRKRVRLWPRFFGEAWAEIRQVTWPTRRETLRLTFAVFVFALVFGLMIALLDFGLDKLFREVIINK